MLFTGPFSSEKILKVCEYIFTTSLLSPFEKEHGLSFVKT